jgi:nucleoprotein TPR
VRSLTALQKPALDRQRAEWEQMKVDCAELAGQLAETSEAKKVLEGKLAEVQGAQTTALEDNKVLQRQVSDLSLQLRNILRQLAIRDDPALAFEAFDPVDGSLKDESDIDLVITNSLVMFNKLPELLELNKRLLRMTRSLGQELEKKEKADGAVDVNGHLGDLDEAADVIQELTRRIQDLEADVREHDAEASLITKERDMFSRMLVQGRLMGMSLENLQAEDNATVQAVLKTIRAEFDHHKEDLQKELSAVQSRLDEKANELREEGNKLADALASLRHEQSKSFRCVLCGERADPSQVKTRCCCKSRRRISRKSQAIWRPLLNETSRFGTCAWMCKGCVFCYAAECV